MPGRPAFRNALAAECTRALVVTSMPSPKRTSSASSASGSKEKSAIALAPPGARGVFGSAFTAQVREQLVARFGQIVVRRSVSPYRPRPRGIVFAAGDHVHVQLAHDVAERADIELVAFDDATQHFHCTGDF